MWIAFMALLACGTFFGAALYVSLVQQPAAMAAGAGVGGRFFPQMFRRAAIMQITMALVGSLCGALIWYQTGGVAWLVGALLLIAILPATVLLLKGINTQLNDPARDPEADAEATLALLRQWTARHGVRTLLGGLAFAVYTWSALV